MMDDVMTLVGDDELRREAERFVLAGRTAAEYQAYVESLFDVRARQRGLVASPGDFEEREAALAAELTKTEEEQHRLRDAEADVAVPLRPTLAVFGKWLVFASVVAAEFGVLAWTGGDYVGVNWDQGWSTDPAGVGIAGSWALAMTWIMLTCAGLLVRGSNQPGVTSAPGPGWLHPSLSGRMLGLLGLILLGFLAGATRRRAGVSFLFLTTSAILLPIAAALIKARLRMRIEDLDHFSELLRQRRRRRLIRHGTAACDKQKAQLIKELERTRGEIEWREQVEDLVSGRKEILRRSGEIVYAEAQARAKKRPQVPRLTSVGSLKARTYKRPARPGWRWLRVLRGTGKPGAREQERPDDERREGMSG